MSDEDLLVTPAELRDRIRAEAPKYLPVGNSYALEFGTAMFLLALETVRSFATTRVRRGSPPEDAVDAWVVDDLIAAAKKARPR